MSKETLLQRLDEWSLEKVKAAISFAPVADINCYYIDLFEYADNGIYIYNSYRAKFITNEGHIETALSLQSEHPAMSNFTTPRSIDKDFNILNQLYALAQSSNSIQLAVVNEVSIVNGYEYRSYTAPNRQLGIPKSSEIMLRGAGIGEEDLKTYIDEVAWILKQVHTIDSSGVFPNVIKLQSQLKNDFGYYYYNIENFSNSYTSFYDHQMTYLKQIGNPSGFPLQYKFPNSPEFSYLDIINYAEEAWTI
jgi:hypothetical protein